MILWLTQLALWLVIGSVGCNGEAAEKYHGLLKNVDPSPILERYEIEDPDNIILQRRETDASHGQSNIDYGSLKQNEGRSNLPRELSLWYLSNNGKPPKDSNTCNTALCRKIADDMNKNINYGANPCDDFDEFACGGWRKRVPIPETSSQVTVFTKLWREEEEILRDLIEKQIDAPGNSSASLVHAWYSSCMNKRKAVNEHGITPLLNIIANFDSCSLMNRFWDSTNWSFLDTLVKMNRISLFPFIVLLPSTDSFNRSRMVLQVSLADLPLSSPKFYFGTDKYSQTVRRSYLRMMVKLWFKLSSVRQDEYDLVVDDIAKDIADMLRLEQKLALVSMIKGPGYKRMRLLELEREVPELDWRKYLLKLYDEIPQKKLITGNELIAVHNLKALKKLSRVLNGVTDRTKANYMMWTTINEFFVHFGPDYENIYEDFVNAMYGMHKRKPVWRRCVYSTSSALGMGVGKLFVEEKFNENSKTKAAQIVEDVRKQLINNFGQTSWMDDETAKRATEKAEAMVKNIGYPGFILNETLVRSYYRGLSFDKEDFFRNIIGRRLLIMNNTLQCREKKPSRKTWSMSPQDINAYYSSAYNKIVFPAGILQQPYWHPDAPMAWQYGGFGYVAGHEITHGFDHQGMRYDKHGNLHNWWSNHSLISYRSKARCLAEQYSNYKIFGNNINGNITLCENIADNGGLRLAYKAYKAWLNEHENDQRLPGLPFNNEQLFFLKSAQMWCANIRRKPTLSTLNVDPHTPKMYRTIGTLSNDKEFSQAFNCAVGSKMNPKKKCSIW